MESYSTLYKSQKDIMAGTNHVRKPIKTLKVKNPVRNTAHTINLNFDLFVSL